MDLETFLADLQRAEKYHIIQMLEMAKDNAVIMTVPVYPSSISPRCTVKPVEQSCVVAMN